MRFTKMHGAGNDYLYVNCFEETVPDPALLAQKVSDRHFGLGSDGLVLLCPSDRADLRMDMYNLDGSRGKMCGNAARCVGKYAYEHGLCRKQEITLETLSGIKTLRLTVESGDTVSSVEVDMGPPILRGPDIPTVFPENQVVGKQAAVGGEIYHVTCVSMGNPHCVIFVEDPEKVPLERVGPLFEHSELFPEGVNTEFVRVEDRRTLSMRVWERGSGETLACGTGACASVVAGVLNGLCHRKTRVKLRGGVLSIRWEEEGSVFMTGPARELFTVEVPYEEVLTW